MSLEQVEIGSFAVPESRPATSDVFRVVSWNIDRGSCFDEIIDFLACTDADLILLQECDLNVLRSGSRNVPREIAQSLNMNYVFGIEFVELSQGQSALHGQATLARKLISNPRVLRFKDQSNFWKPRWFLPNLPRLQRRLGGRMALVSEITVDQRVLAVYNLHLESRCGDDLRARQMREVIEDSRRYGSNGPVLIAGDFNCEATQDPVSAVIHNEQFRNPFAGKCLESTTRHQRLRPSRVIDWMLYRGPFRTQFATVHASTSGSDHFPLSLTLRLS